MSESERVDIARRAFLKKFAIGAVAVPILVTTGVLTIPDIAGADPNDIGYGYGYGHNDGHGHRHRHGHRHHHHHRP